MREKGAEGYSHDVAVTQAVSVHHLIPREPPARAKPCCWSWLSITPALTHAVTNNSSHSPSIPARRLGTIIYRQ